MKHTIKLASVIGLGVLLSACGSDSDTQAPEISKEVNADYTTVTGLDASSAFAYYDLDNNTQLTLTDEQAQSNTQWDIAFKSTNIIINGDYSGPGEVTAAFTGNNNDFRDAQGEPVVDKFTTATPEAELADFLAVTEYAADTEFYGDEFKTVFDSSFYDYNFTSHEVTANDDQYYLFQNADGFYKVRAFSASNLEGGVPGRGLTQFTIGYQFKAADDQTFSAEQTVEIAQCDTQHYVDFSANSEVLASDTWDITVLCDAFEVQLGEGASAYALDGDETDERIATMMEFPQYYLTADFANTVFKHQFKWYEYNLAEGNQIWSQYGVYLVKTPVATYKLQVTSYYNLVEGVITGRQISFIYDDVPQAVAQ